MSIVLEKIEKSGLDWNVEKRPIMFVNPDGTHRGVSKMITDRVANVRIDADGNEKYLGVVGNNYKIIQNRDSFNFLDNLVSEGKLEIKKAGSSYNDRMVWMRARLPGEISIGDANVDDIIGQELLIINRHDGKSSLRMHIAPLRLICKNGMVVTDRARAGSTICHMGNLDEKLNEAHRMFEIAITEYGSLKGNLQSMYDDKINDLQIADYFNHVLKLDNENLSPRAVTRAENIVHQIVTSYKTGPGSAMVRGTMWGAYNAITHYADHNSRRWKSENHRFESVNFGSAGKLKKRAYDVAMEMISGN